MLRKMMLAVFCLGLIILALNSSGAEAEGARPDDHAPIGVMGDHNHKGGEWMLSYRYGQMLMEGNRDGTREVSVDEVHDNYMVAPLEMVMEMHMFGAMVGVVDDLTVMAMLPYVVKSMDHRTRGGMEFSTETEGVGDFKLSGIYTLYDSGDGGLARDHHKALLNFGLSFPTGAIDERGDTPMGKNQPLPYPMQLSSGTYDPLLRGTYLYKREDWSVGAQANMVLRFGENDEGYRLGNEYGLTAWGAYRLYDFVSFSLRLDGKLWGDIEGRDDSLNPMMVPTARTDLRGGRRVDVLLGINLYQSPGLSTGLLSGHRLAAEFGLPMYQDLDGPQLETDYRFTLGWQWAFKL